MTSQRTILKGFIVFEGVDGSGTSTQLALLSKRLEAEGIPANVSAEPTVSPIGTLIREALSGRLELLPATLARLFAADRGEHLDGRGGIKEALDQGKLAISDRFIFSSLAYQGLTCGQELPQELNARFPLPELLVFFDINPSLSLARIGARAEREIFETAGFQSEVDSAYRRVAAGFEGTGMRISVVDASKSVAEVRDAVWDAVYPLASRYRRDGNVPIRRI